MPAKGLAKGELSRPQLQERLVSRFPHAKKYLSSASKQALYGHAVHHGLLTQDEAVKTVPRRETTLACYLRSRIKDPGAANKLDEYVLAWSNLVVRGSWIANLLVVDAAPDLPPNGRTPRWTSATSGNAFRGVAALVSDVDRVKQCFLPERWPTKTARREAAIDAVVRKHGGHMAHLLPDWRRIMSSCPWGQVVNAMARQYLGNVSVHARKGLVRAVEAYLTTFFAPSPTSYVDAFRRLRPLAIGNDDFEMLAGLRKVLGCATPDAYLPDDFRIPFTDDILHLHFFLVWSASADGSRSYLPVSTLGRKYAYFDTRIVEFLEKARKAGEKSAGETEDASSSDGPRTDDGGETEDPPAGESESDADADATSSDVLRRFLALSCAEFKDTTRSARRARREAVRRWRPDGSCGRDARKRALKRGRGRGIRPVAPETFLAKDALVAVSSFRSDGVGLRICVKTAIDARRLVRPVPSQLELETASAVRSEAAMRRLAASASPQHPDPAVASACIERDALTASVQRASELLASAGTAAEKRALRKELKEAKAAQVAASAAVRTALGVFARATAGRFEARDCCAPATAVEEVPPVYVGIDNGRAKPFVAAVSRSPIVKPQTVVFSRRRFHHEIGHLAFRRWERRRLKSRPGVEVALQALSESGGVRNGDRKRWVAFIAAHAAHGDVLRSEYEDVERARWSMRLFRRKRSCLDGAVERLFALGGGRKMIVGVGNASFAATGRGEMAAPTSALTKAMERGVRRRQAPTELRTIWEHRTTLCCCACSAVTVPAIVRDPKTGEERRSRRLRLCTSCDATAPKLRDRDVQAARNILWLTILEHVGAERPTHFCSAFVRQQEELATAA